MVGERTNKRHLHLTCFAFNVEKEWLFKKRKKKKKMVIFSSGIPMVTCLISRLGWKRRGWVSLKPFTCLLALLPRGGRTWWRRPWLHAWVQTLHLSHFHLLFLSFFKFLNRFGTPHLFFFFYFQNFLTLFPPFPFQSSYKTNTKPFPLSLFRICEIRIFVLLLLHEFVRTPV